MDRYRLDSSDKDGDLGPEAGNLPFTSLIGLLQERATIQPERKAFALVAAEGDQDSVTYRDLDCRARAISQLLGSVASRGERAVLVYPTGIEFISAFFGCVYAGLIAVPAHPPRINRSNERLQAIAADAQATVVLTTSAILERRERICASAHGLRDLRWLATDGEGILHSNEAEVDANALSFRPGLDEHSEGGRDRPDGLLYLQYTSGSTTAPKGVMVTDSNVLSTCRELGAGWPTGNESVFVTWLPHFHDMGLVYGIFQPIYEGRPCYILSPAAFLQRPELWLATITRYRATHSGGPDFAYALCASRAASMDRSTLDLGGWSVAFSGAEPVRPQTIDAFSQAFISCGFRRESFCPGYGLAEATLKVSSSRKGQPPAFRVVGRTALQNGRIVTPDSGVNSQTLVGCGLPMLDTSVAIVHPERCEPCEAGEIGEIWVAGPGVAAGYWNRTEETIATFGASLSGSEDGPYLRTGDLGFIENGDLFVVGRLKDLIIIRGRNYYPQDIEQTVEAAHTELRPGSGAAFAVEQDGKERLVVVHELERRCTHAPEEIIADIRRAVLEEHELEPSAIVLIRAGTIPKTTSGKIRRGACKAAFIGGRLETVAAWLAPAAADELTAGLLPVSDRETQDYILSLIGMRFGLHPSQIDQNKSLISYGLDSLGAVELLHKIESDLGIHMEPGHLLADTVIADLIRQILTRPGEQRPSGNRPLRAAPVGSKPGRTSRGQQALWYLHKLSPESAAYNITLAARLKTVVSAEVLRQAVEAVADRHPILRARFREDRDGGLIQSPEVPSQDVFEVVDLSASSDAAFIRELNLQAAKSFDLQHGPAFKTILFRGAAEADVLLITAHHIVADFWSMRLLLGEIGALCARDQAQLQSFGPSIQFDDFVEWHELMLAGPEGDRHWNYWNNQFLTEPAPLELPLDRPRPPKQTFNGRSHCFTIDRETASGIRETGRSAGATLFTTLLAAFQLLLHRHTSQHDFAIGTPATGRTVSGTAGIVGYLVNPVPIRALLHSDDAFDHVLARARSTVLAALDHQDFPFPLLVSRLIAERDPSRSPIFQVMFAFQKAPAAGMEKLALAALGKGGILLEAGALSLESIELEKNSSQFDLTLEVAEVGAGADGSIEAVIEYNTDLFDPTTIQRLSDHFLNLLRAVILDRFSKIATMPLLSDTELSQLTVEWNDTDANGPGHGTVNELLLERVLAIPDRVAVAQSDYQVTYSELDGRASSVADRLKRLGVFPGQAVGVCASRSPELLEAVVGVLRSGAVYVPLDRELPRERLRFICEDTSITALVRGRNQAAQMDGLGIQSVVELSDERSALFSHTAVSGQVCGPVAREDLAYVIYTSGSTGVPKGVMVSHAALANHLSWMRSEFQLQAQDCLLHKYSISFDTSLLELLYPLICGARLVLAPERSEYDPALLVELMREQQVTAIDVVPAMLSALLETGGLESCASLMRITSGGQELGSGLEKRVRERLPDVELANLYGPSESTIGVTYYRCPGAGIGRKVPIGRSITNCQVYVVDSHNQQIPIGSVGEICVGGDGVAAGYVNRPTATAESFIPDLYSNRPGRRLYRTGDRGRWLSDGNLEYFGRLDDQIKIRGYRIEPGEIEVALNALPGVIQAVIVAKDRDEGEKQLVAFVTLKDKAYLIDLKRRLRERLPDFMIPGSVIVVDRMPLTPTGKIDRRALLSLESQREPIESSHIEPATPEERILTGIWETVLGGGPVGVTQNFFELGGDSIICLRVVAAARDAGLDLTASDIMRSPTIRELGSCAVERKLSREQPERDLQVLDGDSSRSHPAEDSSDTFPLTPMQKGMLFHSIYEGETGVYVTQLVLTLTGAVDIRALISSWQVVTDHHPALRIEFRWEGVEEPEQHIESNVRIRVEELDWRHLGDQQRADELDSFLSEDRRKGFNLTRAPLMRFTLIRTEDHRYQLVWTSHHLLMDGWSVPLVMKDISRLYAGYARNEYGSRERRVVRAPAFRRYVEWLQTRDRSVCKQFWEQELEGFDREPSLGFSGPGSHHFAGAEIGQDGNSNSESDIPRSRYADEQVKLTEDETALVYSFARSRRITAGSLFESAWALVLSHYRASDDVIFGLTVSGRPPQLKEADSTVGLFINTLPFRVRVRREERISKWLAGVHSAANRILEHEQDALQDIMHWSGAGSGKDLFDTVFVFENYPVDVAPLQQWADVRVESIRSIEQTNFPITLQITPGAELGVRISYRMPDLSAGTASRILRQLRGVICRLALGAESSELAVGRIAVLTDPEIHSLIFERNRYEAAHLEDECLHQAFGRQANLHPDAIAVVCQEVHLSYREVDFRSARLANRLRRNGSGAETLVGICVDRTEHMIPGLLGILKAGAAYVPLDPVYPDERLEFVASDSGMKILVTEKVMKGRVPSSIVTAIYLDADEDEDGVDRENVEDPVVWPLSDSAAYVIYTSGSTGRPKGVVVTHRNVMRLFAVTLSQFEFSGSDVWSLYHSYAFDFSVWEIWGALIYGGRLVVVPRWVSRSFDEFRDLVVAEGITVLSQTPSAFKQFMPVQLGRTQSEDSLRLIVFGGEALDPRALKPWFDRYGDERPRLVNMYGITETTVHVTQRPLDSRDSATGTRSPIGRPLGDLSVYLATSDGTLAPIGAAAELMVGGDGVSRGYLRSADLTAARFIPDAFSTWPGCRLYRSGDLARYGETGDLEYLGRSDDQVKVRGFRIEPGEIVAVLNSHHAVRQCAVTVASGGPSGNHLIGYIVGSDPAAPSVGQLRSFLAERLPDYMIPSSFAFLEKLPLTPNGKLDRSALRDAKERPIPRLTGDKPRTRTEQILANIWSQVLGVETVGIDDDFFELGGDSIISIQIVSKARESGLRLTPKDIFEHPTISRLALTAAGQSIATETSPAEDIVPLTPIQHWFFEQRLAEQHHYNQAVMLEMRKDAPTGFLDQIFSLLVGRHEALHFRYSLSERGWEQRRSLGRGDGLVHCVDLSAMAESEREIELERAAASTQASLDIENGPLARFVFFDLGNSEPGTLLMTIHHLAVDAISWRILLEEIEKMWASLIEGRPPTLFEPTQFSRWSRLLTNYAGSAALSSEIDYWTFDSAAAFEPLPVDYAEGANSELSRRSVTVSLTAEQTLRLLRGAPISGARINEVLLAALALSFAKWTGRDRLLLDLEGHGREEISPEVETSNTVGWFTTIFPVALDLPGSTQPADALKVVKEQLRRVPRNGIGYGILKYLSGNSRLASGKTLLPKAEVSFNYLGQLDSLVPSDAPFSFTRRSIGPSRSPAGSRSHQIEIDGMVIGGRLEFEWAYSENFHKEETIRRLAESFAHSLRELIEQNSFDPGHCSANVLSTLTNGSVGLTSQERPDAESGYPLSPMQQGMLFHTLYDDNSGVYCTQIECLLKGRMDVRAFERAWQLVAAHEPVLRTAFEWELPGGPVQIVQQEAGVEVSLHDWREVTEAKRRSQLDDYLARDRALGFDLRRAPLMRIALIRTGLKEHYLVWTFHHLLLDGWSVGIVVNELLTAYASLASGTAPRFKKGTPYADYISWLTDQDAGTSEAFWRRYLDGFTSPARLTVDATGVASTGDGSYLDQEIHLSGELTTRIQGLARRNGLTLNSLVQGLWALLLSSYAGTGDVVFGVVVSGRSAAVTGIDSMVGLFINTLPARVQIAPELSLLSWLTSQQSRQLECRKFEHTPLSKVQEWACKKPGEALFDTIFIFENYPLDRALLSGIESLSIESVRTIEQTNYPLTLTATPGERLELQIGYSTRRFDQSSTSRMLHQMESLLASLERNLPRRIGDIPVIAAFEFEVLFESGLGRRNETGRCSVQQLFGRQVIRTPETVAIVFEDLHVTFGLADKRSERLACYLSARGFGSDDFIGICLERSADFILAVLAVMRLRAACVPIDPETPDDRVSVVIEDSAASVVLTDRRLASRPSYHGAPIICVDDQSVFWEGPGRQNPDADRFDDPAYVIYTSGSTGRPKGVVVAHSALTNHMLWLATEFPLDSIDRILHKYSIAFDASWLEVFYPLITGSTLVIARAGGQVDVDYLLDLISREQITALDIVPSMLSALLRSGELGRCTSLRQLTAGAESLNRDLVERTSEQLPGAEIVNTYGPTEATIICAYHRIGPSIQSNSIPIGRAISNSQVYVLDPLTRFVPFGAVGEIHVGGQGLAWGYLNRPELTAERFIPSPIGVGPGERLYRTGDLGRAMPHGALEFCGRSDNQVKLHGFRIELEEIESSLKGQIGVRDALVIGRRDGSRVNGLIAFVVMDEGYDFDPVRCRRYLSKALPEYMVPAVFVQIDQVPLTPSGKIDRAALSTAGPAQTEGAPDSAPPRTALQERLVAIWVGALGVDRIGINDNFFALGGDSIISIQLVSRARRSGIHLTHQQLFEHPTIAELSRVISGKDPFAGDVTVAVGPESDPAVVVSHDLISGEVNRQLQDRTSGVEDVYPLTPTQEGILFHALYEPESSAYCMQVACELDASLDPASFIDAWQLAVDSHAALRTGFEWKGLPSPVQLVHARAALPVIHEDWSDLPGDLKASRLGAFMYEDRRRGYQLGSPPLMRLALIRLDDGSYQCVWSCHHLILDGWSLSLILKEVLSNYRLIMEGRRPERRAEPPYRAYVEWLLNQDRQVALEYWREVLKGSQPARLSKDRSAGADRDGNLTNPAEAEIHLTENDYHRLRHFASRFNATVSTVLESAWALLLCRYLGTNDVIYGRVVSGRPEDLAGVEETIGLFINTLPFSVRVASASPVFSLIESVRSAAIEQRRFEHLSSADIQKAAGSEVPLFDNIFVFENYPIDASVELWYEGGATGPRVKNLRSIETTNYPLALIAMPGRGIRVRIAYNANLFENVTILRMLRSLGCIVDAILSCPERPAGDLPMLSAEEHHQITVEWNDQRSPYPVESLISEIFDARRESFHDAIAVQHGDQQVSYQTLSEGANGLANHLVTLKGGFGQCVALCLERGIEMITAMLAVAKAGAQYLPLDPRWPRERLLALLVDSQAAAVVTSQRFAELLKDFSGPIMCLTGDFVRAPSASDLATLERMGAQLPLYTIYTSGSTGAPKGICVPHSAVSRLVINSNYVEFEPGAVVAQAAPASFDAATFEIWGPLLNGGRILVVDKDTTLSARRLENEILVHRIGKMFLTTALFNQMVAESPNMFRSMDTLLFGGERVNSGRVNRLSSAEPPENLIHVYGPTETTTFASWCPVKRMQPDDVVPIGRPISNTQLYLLDADLRPVQAGMPGELYIGGDGLALGYLNGPSLTAERFMPDPFAEEPDRRLYRTGDIAIFGSGGAIEFVGRADTQLKIRGFRIEPAEVEAALRLCAGVKGAVVALRENTPGDRRLIAYVVPDKWPALNHGELRRELAGLLPEYMIPSAFIAARSLALNENGKIDRKALLRLEEPSTSLGGTRTPARTDTEEVLCRMSAEVLETPVEGVFDDFFELGGHSLLAMRIASRVRDFFEVDLQVRDVFECHTVAELAARVKEVQQQKGFKPPVIEAGPERRFVPLSFAQQRLWFLDQIEACGAAYNVPAVFRARGRLNLAALEQSLAEISRRHEILRTSFPTNDGPPYQAVSDRALIPIRVVDLTGVETEGCEASSERLIRDETLRTFELATGPVWRAGVLQLADDQALLLLTLHHIVADGWSVAVMLREIRGLYTSFSLGGAADLEQLAIQYADYSFWQREWLRGEVLNAHLSYWCEKLGDNLPAAELPLDRPRPAIRAYLGAALELELAEDVAAKVGRLGLEYRATPFMTFLASFYSLMRRYACKSDLRVGTVIANRNAVQVEPLIGYFANTLVLRNSVPSEATFAELLRGTRTVALDAYKHEDLPFELVVDALRPERSLSETPLFQVMFVLNRDSRPSVTLPDVDLAAEARETYTAKFDLTVSVEEIERRYILSFEYDTEVFERPTMERMLGHWQTLLSALVDRPGQRIDEAPLLSGSERQMLVLWSRPGKKHSPSECLHKLFQDQVLAAPDAIAVAHEGEQLSYECLDISANRLANYLRRLGIVAEDVVGIYLERSVEMIVSILAVLKAGGGYVPLEPGYPKERLAYVVEDSGTQLVLTVSSLREKLVTANASLLCLDHDSELIEAESPATPLSGAVTQNLAYVIYTSGSTGRPKGVAVSHENVVRLFEATDSQFNFNREDVWTQFHSYAFDFSVWEIWGALARGGKLVIVPYVISREPESFHRLLVKDGVTILNQTPSAFKQLMRVDEELGTELALRAVIFGGEAFDPRSLAGWIDRRGDRIPKLVNMYGITETTVHVTYKRLSLADARGGGGSPIGSPIEDLGVYLLGDSGELLPAGVTGEMYVAGAGLCRGYLGKPHLTAERFLPDCYSSEAGGRLYRSGDLAKRPSEGHLVYVGRADQQVKLRGYRIELGEIESRILGSDGVKEARAIVTGDATEDRKIAAYVVLSPDGDVSRIREQLRRDLPDYMLPAFIVGIDRMPLTQNGKLDVRSLPPPEPQVRTLQADWSAPVGEVEQVIARIWRETLSLECVSVDENFFDLGGNSMSMVHVRNRIRQLLNKELTMVDMFTYTTIRSLAEHMANCGSSPQAALESGVEMREESKRKQRRNRLDRRVSF